MGALTWARNVLTVARMELATACAAKRRAISLAPTERLLQVRLQGYSTDAIRRIGASSLRITCDPNAIEPGSYLMALRAGTTWLPALSAVPGDLPDSRGSPRNGMAELLIMARPIALEIAANDDNVQCDPHACTHVTCLSDETLRHLFDSNDNPKLELMSLQRVAPFVDKMSEPLWLKTRMRAVEMQATEAALKWCDVANDEEDSIDWLLRDSPVTCGTKVEVMDARAQQLLHDQELSSPQHGDQLCGGGSWRSPSRPFGGREQFEI